MLPIGDDNSDRRLVPVVTHALIAFNVLFFLVELGGTRISSGHGRLSLSASWHTPPWIL
jgi:hypothetical protein